MTGIGVAAFPIATKKPEVQRWFDQGNALLPSFWFYGGERVFRGCLKLEPENGMAYWGLSRSTDGDKRPAEMIREAVKRKERVTERERLFIEAQAAGLLPDPLRDKDDGKVDYDERGRRQRNQLETLCVKYPDDMATRATPALAHIGDSQCRARHIIHQPRRPPRRHLA